MLGTRDAAGTDEDQPVFANAGLSAGKLLVGAAAIALVVQAGDGEHREHHERG
jgi:hypothetical protein